MARGYRDPWKKKSQKGMKLLSKMLDVGIKVGKVATRKTSKRRKPVNKSPGCIVLLIVTFILATCSLTNFS